MSNSVCITLTSCFYLNYITKKIFGLLAFLLFSFSQVFAQKVDYKSGSLSIDGQEIAHVIKLKEKGAFGLASNFELDALSGEKLIIATLATDFKPDRSDNSKYYYRFTFLTTNQVAIFSLSILSAEKSFARLVGESGILVNDHLDAKKVTELIALKSANPEVTVEYHLVQRERDWPVSLKDGGEVYQGNVLIGKFKDVSESTEASTYEFSLPDGLVVAKVSFKGGNAKQFLITTNRDRLTESYTINIDSQFGAMIYSSVDKNETSLKRAAKWLVKNEYL